MRTEEALNQLSSAIKEGEDKRDILLINSLSCSQLQSLIVDL